MGNFRKDGLCRKHAKMLKDGLLIQNDQGKFIEVKPKETFSTQKEVSQGEEKKDFVGGKCIVCGRETTNGNLFCLSCYHKYKDKELLVKIIKCKEVKILDDSYEEKYTCKDGHVVKSKSEVLIDDYLFDHGIPHAYEKAVSIDANEAHDLLPDFFLPKFGSKHEDIYIEHWGFDEGNNPRYFESKKYKIEQYKKLGF